MHRRNAILLVLLGTLAAGCGGDEEQETRTVVRNEAESRGSTNCATNKKAPTKQRYSVKLDHPIDVGGRPTARTVNAFFTETTNGCTVKPARGVVSWRGRLDR